MAGPLNIHFTLLPGAMKDWAKRLRIGTMGGMSAAAVNNQWQFATGLPVSRFALPFAICETEH